MTTASSSTATASTGNGPANAPAMNVPLLDLKAQYASLRDEIEPVVKDVVESQWFIMGPEVSAFEEEVAAYLGVKHAVGCSSGTDAILLACMALDLGCGAGRNDRIVCPSYSFFSTAGSVSRLGAFPVFADIDPTTYNVTPERARAAIASQDERIAVSVPVHLFGQAVDMDGWLELANELDVPLIEDAAQAIGTKDSSGAMVGTRGTVGCFSFFPSKNLGGFGDGGLITTNDDAIAQRLRELRMHGMEPKYYHNEIGINGRLDALQAAVLRVKLRHLESWHAGRAANAATYDKLFSEAGARTSGAAFEAGEAMPLRTPTPAAAPARHVYNQYVIRVPAAIREPLRAHLRERTIGHEVYYPVPIHRQACYEYLGMPEGSLPESEAAAKETLALPVYPELASEQIRYVVATISDFVRQHAGASLA